MPVIPNGCHDSLLLDHGSDPTTTQAEYLPVLFQFCEVVLDLQITVNIAMYATKAHANTGEKKQPFNYELKDRVLHSDQAEMLHFSCTVYRTQCIYSARQS